MFNDNEKIEVLDCQKPAHGFLLCYAVLTAEVLYSCKLQSYWHDVPWHVNLNAKYRIHICKSSEAKTAHPCSVSVLAYCGMHIKQGRRVTAALLRREMLSQPTQWKHWPYCVKARLGMFVKSTWTATSMNTLTLRLRHQQKVIMTMTMVRIITTMFAFMTNPMSYRITADGGGVVATA